MSQMSRVGMTADPITVAVISLAVDPSGGRPLKKSASARDRATTIRQQTSSYLAALPPDARRAVRTLGATIRAAAPGVEDAFSYGIPGFTFNGERFLWYAGWKTHASLYPISDAFAKAHGISLDGYTTSKGTIRFPLDEPLPLPLIRRLVKARLHALKEA